MMTDNSRNKHNAMPLRYYDLPSSLLSFLTTSVLSQSHLMSPPGSADRSILTHMQTQATEFHPSIVLRLRLRVQGFRFGSSVLRKQLLRLLLLLLFRTGLVVAVRLHMCPLTHFQTTKQILNPKPSPGPMSFAKLD